jgi:predicted nucleic-acid-binding Zn-ribbon protein
MSMTVNAAFDGKPIHCQVCAGDAFLTREIKMNTTGMEFMNVAFANQSALGLICTKCGYIHEFMGELLVLTQA